MIEVVNLAEGLNLGPLLDLLLSHFFGDFSGITINTSYKGMSIGFVLCSFVIVLNNDSFSSSVAPCKHQHHFTRFHELPHDWAQQYGRVKRGPGEGFDG